MHISHFLLNMYIALNTMRFLCYEHAAMLPKHDGDEIGASACADTEDCLA